MATAIRPAARNDVPTILAVEQQAPGAAHWTRDQYNQLVSSGIVLVAEEDRPALRICVCAGGRG